METQDPVMKAVTRAAELYSLHNRLEEEEWQFERDVKTVAGNTDANRDRLYPRP